MRDSSSTVKNISLELGGNAPFAVFSDANLDKKIEGFFKKISSLVDKHVLIVYGYSLREKF